jgi:hypothetical protein
VIGANANAEGYDEAQLVTTIEHYLGKTKEGDPLDTKMLKRCLSDYAELSDIVICAENNINILQLILDIANVSETEKNSYLEQFINDEIAKPNNVELSVYEEIEYNELVISCNGDMELTEVLYEERQEKRKKELNLISEMIDWIYGPQSDEEVNGQVRKNMFTLTENLHKKGVDQYVENYRNRVKDTHPAILGDYSTEVDFNNRAAETKKITSHYEEERNVQLSQIKYIMSIIGAVILAAGIGVTIYFMTPAYLVLSAAGALVIVYNIVSNRMQKKHIEETCQMNIHSKNEMMDALFAEYEIYKKTFEEYDGYYDRIVSALGEF